MSVVTRIPPSPTGHLHIGTARTALFNYLFAKSHGGVMLYRSEDTDKERSKREYETEIIEGLKKLGITWDNDKEIVRQSERVSVYKDYLRKVIDADMAYVSREVSQKDASKEVEVVRLRNPNKTLTFKDLIRGDITFDTTELGDFVIARSIDDALYHFTVVVDDHEMGVTHVLRGEDHISNTSRQILIQESLGFERPQYAHLPLILAPDRSKMSKRHGAVAVEEYLNDGYLPETIVNYLALLGWNGGGDKEVYSLAELISVFKLEEVNNSGAVFDPEKLLWLNKEHLARFSDEEFVEYVNNYLPEDVPVKSDEFARLLPALRERISVGKEVTTVFTETDFSFVFNDIEVNDEILKWKKDEACEDYYPRLRKVVELLQNCNFDSPESIKECLWQYAEEVGKGEVLWPLRVALTGLERSPDPFTCLFILGKKESIRRIEAVIK